ncbi:MAG: FdhF/YdeP family oxidoreductase [Deinococcales bacterium]
MAILLSKAKHYVKEPDERWHQGSWASNIPFSHPDNFLEVFKAAWENRDNLPYAYRILNEGVCDGCALGTSGMNDWTIDGIHLCNIRLRLLRLNTMSAFSPSLLADVSSLIGKPSRELRELGRIPQPMIRKKGDKGFKPLSWDDALNLIAEGFKQSEAHKRYVYMTSRGIPNETYYAVQKAVRAMGMNNLDNAARLCHSPSTFALKAGLGVGATTCSYSDFIGTDVVTFIGSNPAKNQPLIMKYLYHAKKAGTKVVMVNPYFEPGMDAYWVPSDLESAMFGTKITDHFFQIAVGGDIAFLHGTLKSMIENQWLDETFISQHTEGFADLKVYLNSLSWQSLEKDAGLPASTMHDYARLLSQADKAIFVWGMGITQHHCGEDNVQAIINLALSKGFVGRKGCGLMPIRGHSGVQGGAEMGAYATAFPGGKPVNAETAKDLSALYGFDVPGEKGMTTPEMLDAAAKGDLEVLFAIGGNFREAMPDPYGIDEAMANIPLRVHMDIVLSSQMLTNPKDTVILLPAMTRYEIPGGVTETSTERRIIFSPEVMGPRVEGARPEWEVLCEIAARVYPQHADKVRFANTQAIREEIARAVPFYKGIETLKAKGDNVQYGGPMLCENWQFPTIDGKAHFQSVKLPDHLQITGKDEFIIVTRRGKQFNSIVHQDLDPMNQKERDAVLISAQDAERLSLKDGDKVVLENDFGQFSGVLSISNLASGSLQVHYPEANVLVDPKLRSKLAQIPAYKEVIAHLRLAAPGEVIPLAIHS